MAPTHRPTRTSPFPARIKHLRLQARPQHRRVRQGPASGRSASDPRRAESRHDEWEASELSGRRRVPGPDSARRLKRRRGHSQFREFGIRLSFNPQVTENGTIKLYVKPEVNTLDLANSVSIAGFSIPALATRKIETNIELGEGTSFVIGGLLDDRVTIACRNFRASQTFRSLEAYSRAVPKTVPSRS